MGRRAFLIRVFTTLTSLNLSRSGGEARMWRQRDQGASESAGEEACPYFTCWQPEFINSKGSFWVSDFSSWLSFHKETMNSHIATMGRALVSLVSYLLCVLRALSRWVRGGSLGGSLLHLPPELCACAHVRPCVCVCLRVCVRGLPPPFPGKICLKCTQVQVPGSC